MEHYFLLTFVGDDHPGFVESIAKVIADRQGNWLESRMSQMEGKFAGLAKVSVAAARADELKRALVDLAANDFALSVEDLSKASHEPQRQYQISIIGHDRPGIVHEVTHALASQNINVVEMVSNVITAAMTGAQMFSAEVRVDVPRPVDVTALDGQLMVIAAELGIEIVFHEASD